MKTISFAGMLSRYAFEFEEKDKNNNYLGDNPSVTGQNSSEAPLYSIYSGIYELWDKSLPWNAGYVQRIWASTASTNEESATNLALNPKKVVLHNGWYRYQGFSFRYWRTL